MSPKHNQYEFNNFRRKNFSNNKTHNDYDKPNSYRRAMHTNRELVNWGAVFLYKSRENGLLKGMRETYQINFLLELPAGYFLHIGSGIVRIDPPFNLNEKKSLESGDMQALQTLISRDRIVEDIARYADGTPIIPASSLKGALRSRLELILTDLYACFIVTKKRRGSSKKYKKLYYPLTRPRISDAKIKLSSNEFNEAIKRNSYLRRRICIICDMFGRNNDGSSLYFRKRKIKIKVPALMSKILFSDAVLVTDVKLEKNKKYGVPHYVIVGPAEFSATITAYNIHRVELALLLFGLTSTYKGNPLLLGRYKYYDEKYGRIKVPFEKIKIRKIDVLNGIPTEVPFKDFSDISKVKSEIGGTLKKWSIQQ